MSNFLTNLVASYEMEGNGTDEHAGLNMTLSGPAFTDGVFGGGLSFDGTNDSMEIADNASMDAGSGSMTLETWIIPAAGSLGGSGKFLVGKRGGGGAHDQGYQWDLSNIGAGKPRAYISDGANSAAVNFTSVLSASTAYQLLMVVDRNDQKLRAYLNGTQQGSDVDISSVGSLSNSDPFAYGYFTFLVSNYYEGIADRTRLWIGRALTGVEPGELYNGGAGLAYASLGGSSSSSGDGSNIALGVI